MKKWSRLLVLVLAIGLAACQTPIETHHEYDASAPFDQYTSFAWITDQSLLQPGVGYTGGELKLSPLLEQEIRAAVDGNLEQKGYQKRGDPRSADLVISFSLGAREKVEINSYPVRAGYRYGPYGGPRGAWVSDVYTYTEGTLAIDVFDGQTNRAVWHGWATGRVSPSADQEKREARVNEAVDAILAEFPLRNPEP
jgi:hypothetical protein